MPRRYFKTFKEPTGIDSNVACAGILEQSMGANRVGTGSSYRPARLHSTKAGEIDSLESIPGPHKSKKVRL